MSAATRTLARYGTVIGVLTGSKPINSSDNSHSPGGGAAILNRPCSSEAPPLVLPTGSGPVHPGDENFGTVKLQECQVFPINPLHPCLHVDPQVLGRQ